MTNLVAIISLAVIVSVCSVMVTGHWLFWWLARGCDAVEAAHWATARCLLPWWRLWRRQFAVELDRLRQEEA